MCVRVYVRVCVCVCVCATENRARVSVGSYTSVENINNLAMLWGKGCWRFFPHRRTLKSEFILKQI